MGVVFPLVLAAVDDHEPGAQIDQQREAHVVGQRRCCGGQVTLLRRRGGAVARHRAEHRLPVGCPDPLAEHVARHQVDLVAVGVGVADPERSGCLTKTRLLDRRGRPHHVEVDAVSKRPRLRRLPDPDRGVAPQRILQAAVIPRRVIEHALPEPPHHSRVRRIRTRRSGAAARQGSRPARDLTRPPTPPRRARLSRGAPACLSPRRSTTISADSSTMRPASAAPSTSDGTSNHAVATPSTTRQSVPISGTPGKVAPSPADFSEIWVVLSDRTYVR